MKYTDQSSHYIFTNTSILYDSIQEKYTRNVNRVYKEYIRNVNGAILLGITIDISDAFQKIRHARHSVHI